MIDLEPAVVTGLGAIGAAGCGRQSLEKACRDSAARWSEVDRSAGYHRRGGARLAGLTAGADLSPWLSPMAARRMSPASKLAVASAKMALEDAGAGEEPLTAVVVSNAHGPTSLIETILDQDLRLGPLAVSPAAFTESVANAPAAQVAIACRAVGPNLTITQREAGALVALAQGAAEIARGRVRRALVLAVDELSPLLHAILDRFGALTRAEPRPFDRRRDGFVAAEGACALVLEREAAARARNAPILARIRASASGFDPRAPRIGWSDDPAPLARALTRLLARTGLAPGDVDRIVSGASGSPAGDRLEARVLRAAWNGDALPPVLVPKAFLGEHGGALLAPLVPALAGAPFGPTPGFAELDPELGVRPHDGRPLAPPRRLLATALASGGAGAWVILERE